MKPLWDPLDSVSQQSAEVVASARRREIRNILKSYVGFYDPFAEALQNAMDAVDKRKRIETGAYEPHLWISIDLRQNQLSVTDNGCGFYEEEFKTFLCPNVSFKDGETTRGRKGVGATYLAYGFNFLQLGTKSPGYQQLAEIRDGRQWIEVNSNPNARPQVTESANPPSVFGEIDRGSTFTIKFAGPYSRPSDLGWILATTAEQWDIVFRLKTPLGQILFPWSQEQPIAYDLEVIDKNGQQTVLKDRPAGYLWPQMAIPNSVNLADVLAWQEQRLKKNQDASVLPTKFRNRNAIYHIWNTKEAADLLLGRNKEPDQLALLAETRAEVYAFFCYSVRLWDSYNDNVAKLRKSHRILHGGLQLATNGMPQGELITIPLTSTIGYQNQSHVIVHLSNAEPDLGRKGFQPELQQLAQNLAVGAVENLKRWRRLLKKDSGAAPEIKAADEVARWIHQQEDHQKNHPLVISHPQFFIPLNEVSILSEPQSEQDVIALFNQLVAGGVIRGVKLMATNQHERYDGIFRYSIAEPLENHRFDLARNPLGVQNLSYHEPYSSQPRVLEYKYNLDALISEFENEEKHEQDVSLAIVWETGEEWRKRYNITSLLDSDNLHYRDFHGLTHIVNDEASGDRRFRMIVLSELVQYLKDVQGTEAAQRNKYEGSI